MLNFVLGILATIFVELIALSALLIKVIVKSAKEAKGEKK